MFACKKWHVFPCFNHSLDPTSTTLSEFSAPLATHGVVDVLEVASLRPQKPTWVLPTNRRRLNHRMFGFFPNSKGRKKTWALKRREISWLWMWTGKLWRRWYEWTTCEVWYKNWISTTKRTKCNCTSRAEILTIDWFYRRKIGVSFHSSLQMIGVFLSDFLDPKCLAPKFKSSGNVTERPKSPPPMRHKLTQTCQHAFVQNDHTTTAWKVMVGSWPLGPITLRIFEVSFLCFQFLRKLLAVCRQNIFPIQDMLLLKMLLLRIY